MREVEKGKVLRENLEEDEGTIGAGAAEEEGGWKANSGREAA